MKLRIAVDGVSAVGGADAVLSDVISAAVAHPDFEEVLVAVSNPRLASKLTGGKVRAILIPPMRPNAVFRLHWLSVGFPRFAERHRADGALCLAGGGATASGVPAVVFLQQALLFEPNLERFFSQVQKVRWEIIKAVVFRSAKIARAVFVQTNVMADLVRTHIGVPSSRIHVFFPSPPQLPAPPSRVPHALVEMARAKEDQRFLYVGYDYPYKGIELLREAAGPIIRNLPDFKLFLTLPRDERFADAPSLHAVGLLSRPELHCAYRMARGVVLPSLCETVGLPLLEAMRCGVPPIAANLPYSHEVCGNAGTYFDPRSHQALAGAIASISEPGRWMELSALALERAKELRRGNPYLLMLSTFKEAIA